MMANAKTTLLSTLLVALGLLPHAAPAAESRDEARPGSAGAVVALPQGCTSVGRPIVPLVTTPPAGPAFLPAQLEIRTPFEPTAFPSGGRNFLVYELHLRSFAGEPLDLQGLEVTAGDGGDTVLATFDPAQLVSQFQPRGHDLPDGEVARHLQLSPGGGAVAYLCLAFEPGVTVPATLGHRVLVAGAHAHGPSISTRRSDLRVFGPPVAGRDWIAAGGPGNTSHHRVGLLVMGGEARISRRYAIDWRQVREGATFSGDPIKATSHHAYGQPVYAVDAGVVVAAADGLPDNIPRTSKGFETALPVTMETIAGNAVVLDLGGGHFALYAHLAPGSVLVKQGDRVARGQALGRIGNSGDSREPHLHFEVTDRPELLAGEGLPYVIDRYDIRLPDGSLDARTHELPTLELPVDFGPAEAARD